MKNQKTVVVVALLLVLTFTLGFTYQSNQSKGSAWEFKFEYGPSEKKANELGGQGWELVAIQSTGPGLGNNVPTYVFKRLK